ncbi:MAG: hypothetical protein GY821_02075 [Gammaproteobacteria bacterium]|nr:hypothetical protein [Gammaproteobacteria bacterium]
MPGKKKPSYSKSVHKNYCFDCHACAFHEKPYLENKTKEKSTQTAELVI